MLGQNLMVGYALFGGKCDQSYLAVSFDTYLHSLSLSLPLSLSRFLPFPPWVSTFSDPGSQDRTINGTLSRSFDFIFSSCVWEKRFRLFI